MPLTRTIYTQGSVTIVPMVSNVSYLDGTPYSGLGVVLLSGVQSANFTANSPKVDVNSFGVFGAIDKVQVEPSTATLELSMVLITGGVVPKGWLSGLVHDAIQSTPSGFSVTVSGVGKVTSGVLTSWRLESSVGALPTISVTFDGVSGAYPAAPAASNTYTTLSVGVATPDTVTGIFWNGSGNVSPEIGCPQSIRLNWEMPVERLNCLGNPIDQPTIFTRPPGTFTIVTEGIDYHLLGNFPTGINIGQYHINASNIRETARTVNMAVGDAAATFNVTAEATAIGTQVSEP